MTREEMIRAQYLGEFQTRMAGAAASIGNVIMNVSKADPAVIFTDVHRMQGPVNGEDLRKQFYAGMPDAGDQTAFVTVP